MLNLHRILFKDGDPVSFHAELVPLDRQRLALIEAKNAIRDHLRVSIADASKSALGMSRRVEPRFRTQGSWSYRICVRPAHLPPQEMDWDFGVYLPATIWQGHHPIFAARAYFELVESSLKVLCKKRPGWALLEGAARKDNCIRIRIAPWAHIDIPLYAAPEAQFDRISELAKSLDARRSVLSQDSAQYLLEDSGAGEPSDWPWEQLQEIVMATRKGEWKASDPFRVWRWNVECIEEHGAQLQRISRYLKGWRDYQWESGGPASLTLMVCAADSFERRHHRDDLALQDAAERMSNLLRKDLFVRAIDGGEENFNPLDERARADAADRAAALRWAIQSARGYGASMQTGAIEKLQSVLGPRLPSNADLIEAETSTDRVRATAAATVAPPIVRATRSG
jgi:hypothetical protein